MAYHKLLHRLLSLLLLVLIGFSSIGPALSAKEDAGVPACCRKAGKHQCAMGASDHSQAASHLMKQGKCPLYPAWSFTAAQAFRAVPASVQIWSAHAFASPAGRVQTEARGRTSFTRAQQKRGPPPNSPRFVS